MNAGQRFSFARLWAMVVKEALQLRRDRPTAALIFGIPILQTIVFGFIINTDPRDLPTSVILADDSPQARSLVSGFANSGYYKITLRAESEADAGEAMQRGDVQFTLHVPAGFGRDLLAGRRPELLIEADAADPIATRGALSAVPGIIERWMESEFRGPLAGLAPAPAPVDVRIHARYNPEIVTAYNIVPGLMGVVLTMTLVLVTALAITRERERGTIENLLAMPLRPAEVLLGKITLYIIIGYIQVGLILLAAHYVFGVPVHGNLFVLLVASLFFIAANLALGITFSTIARNQLQAMQMALFIFLPSILLSGFAFPFRGMPVWAQWLGELLPITHFIRVARGVMLRATSLETIAPDILAIAAFAAVLLGVGVTRYRQTLD